MTILHPNEPWPMEPAKDPATGIVRQVKVELGFIVNRGSLNFARKTGHFPTHVLFGPEAQQILDELTTRYATHLSAIVNPDEEFMGLKVRRVNRRGIELLWGGSEP